MGQTGRAGTYVNQPTGYRAFVPAPLPPDPPIEFNLELVELLSRADLAVGRLDGIAETLPNPDLFVAMYVRREAVESSQIEGTQSTLDDVLSFELDPRTGSVPRDIEEVVNYVAAMNFGIQRLTTLPLSLRLIREIHQKLLEDVRGAERSPGEFRRSQNWIGPGNAGIAQATFVPPPPHILPQALANFEDFVRRIDLLPALVQCGIAHAQFETIHPFLDGNGRVGRLLITFQLMYRGVMRFPLLSVSTYLKRHRLEYYDRLMAVRNDGNWEEWLRFFLRGIAETAEEAVRTSRAIVRLRERHRDIIQGTGLGANELRLLDLIFRRPLLNVALIKRELSITDVTASRLVNRLVGLGMLSEVSGRQRNRVFRHSQYLELFEDHAQPSPTI